MKSLMKQVTKKFGKTGVEDLLSVLENSDEMAKVMGYAMTEDYINDTLLSNFSITSSPDDLREYAKFLRENSLEDLKTNVG